MERAQKASDRPKPGGPFLEQDLKRDFLRATALEQRDRRVQVDIVSLGEFPRGCNAVAGALELLLAPRFDAVELGPLLGFRRSHHLSILRFRFTLIIRSNECCGSPYTG
jgi:hypothetical protein